MTSIDTAPDGAKAGIRSLSAGIEDANVMGGISMPATTRTHTSKFDENSRDQLPARMELALVESSAQRQTEPNNKGALKTGSSSVPKTPWTAEEDESLLVAVLRDRRKRGIFKQDENDSADDDDDDWDEIAKAIPQRTPVQCLKRFMKHLTRERKYAPKIQVRC